MTGDPRSADTLLRAAAKARSLRGRTLVVKLGGSAMEEPAATRGTLESVAALQTLGVRLVLVHGGGKPIDRAMAAAGLTPKKVQGRRYTDEATLGIVTRVLIDEINVGLERQFASVGGLPRGFNDGAPCVLDGERLALTGGDGSPIDLGRVGRVTGVRADLLLDLLGEGLVPILPSLAVDSPKAALRGGDPDLLNVNADTAASAVAGALKAEACFFLTDAPGVLRNRNEPGSVIPRLTADECRRLIADRVIDGGMIPKVEACFDALAAGAGRAVILDGRDPYALLGEFVSDRVTGTEIVN
jgi:acetylglutamate kinase